jgi:hypothetical protein
MCEESFQQMKHLLTHAPMLKIVDPNKDLLVCTDACKEGLGGVLMQERHVIFYESKKLNDHEMNYVTHDLELAAIVHSLTMWRNCLLGRKVLLMKGYSGLRYLFDQLLCPHNTLPNFFSYLFPKRRNSPPLSKLFY